MTGPEFVCEKCGHDTFVKVGMVAATRRGSVWREDPDDPESDVIFEPDGYDNVDWNDFDTDEYRCKQCKAKAYSFESLVVERGAAPTSKMQPPESGPVGG